MSTWFGSEWDREPHISDKEVFKKLEGRIIMSVTGKVGDEEVLIKTACGITFRLYHQHDCCESVNLHDVDGDLQDLVGHKVVLASMESNAGNEHDDATGEEWRQKPSEYSESWTWTFVKIQSMGASLTMRWLGESNGYYGEEVSVEATLDEDANSDACVVVGGSHSFSH